MKSKERGVEEMVLKTMPKADEMTVFVNVWIRDNLEGSSKRIYLFRIQGKLLATSDKMKQQKPIVAYKGFYFGRNMFAMNRTDNVADSK
jgi:hypothetical protein